MQRIEADWLFSQGAQTIMDLISASGHEIYFVGGCVRNALIDGPATDVDMATSARPDQMLHLAEASHIRCIPTGIDHGTVTWIVDDQPYEITTYRRDVETDGRRARVRFSDTLEEDARRRDFTMNALYCDARGTVVDPVGGVKDLREGRVRFIGVPAQRIAEDYLRVLRFFRFHAWYGDDAGGIDAEGLSACAEASDKLAALSRERVGAEIMKLLAADNPETALGAMEQSGVLSALLPDAGTKLLFALSALPDAPRDPQTRLAALCDVEAAQTLRLSKRDLAQIRLLREHLSSPATIEELAYRHGVDTAISVGFLRSAAFETPPGPEMVATAKASAAAIFPLKAQDIMHVASGAELGRALRSAERHWIEKSFAPDREGLVAYVESGRWRDGG